MIKLFIRAGYFGFVLLENTEGIEELKKFEADFTVNAGYNTTS